MLAFLQFAGFCRFLQSCNENDLMSRVCIAQKAVLTVGSTTSQRPTYQPTEKSTFATDMTTGTLLVSYFPVYRGTSVNISQFKLS